MKNWYSIFLLILGFASCTSESSFIDEPHKEVENDSCLNKNVLHNRWTYSKMSQHYYWNEEMPDSLSIDFSMEPEMFFEKLLSRQDRFSWCETNLNYKDNDIGFEYQTYELHGSFVNRVLYVSSSGIREKGLKRGHYFIFKGKTIEIGEIQQKLFKSNKVINLNTRSQNLAPTSSLDTIYTIKDKRIGYFVYDQFNSSTDVSQIAIRLKNRGIDELIIDLRYNPGGYVHTSNYLASILAPIESLGKLYQLQRFNKIQTKIKQEKGGSGVDSVFLDKGFIASQRNLNLGRIVVLTTKNTASASESLIIGLRPYMDVVTIGTTSCGKDVGSYTIADNRYKYQLQPITFRYYNAFNDSTPTTGIIPDIEVADDLNHERGDVNEALLKTAIDYLTGNIAGNETRSVQSSTNEKEYGKSSIEIRNNL